MRPAKLILAVAIVGVLGGFGTEAWAAGGGEPCVVTTRSEIQGADKLRGSAVIVLRNFDGTEHAESADATLTLTSDNGTTAVFRKSISNPTVTSAEMVMCEVLEAKPTTSSGATMFDVFGFAEPVPPQTVSDILKLCLVVRRLKSGKEVLDCQSIGNLDFSQIEGTNDWSGTTDPLTIYRIR